MNAEQLKLEFGCLLKQLRKDKGLSQEQVAHECSLDRTYISMLERGINQPSLLTILSLSSSLGMSATELISKFEKVISDTKNG